MAIFRWYDRPDYFRISNEVERMQRDLNRLLSDVMGTPTAAAGVFPPLNIYEDAENLYVSAELPGIKPEEIDISVEGDTLSIRGERKLVEAGQAVSYHRREREAGQFRRTVTLPVKINVEAVKAHFKHGVLELTLPKTPEVRPKQIKVKTGA